MTLRNVAYLDKTCPKDHQRILGRCIGCEYSFPEILLNGNRCFQCCWGNVRTGKKFKQGDVYLTKSSTPILPKR